MEMPASTPMMKQYREIKKDYPDSILFYRMGDFYEMFGEDALIASKVMNIALTSRDKRADNPVPMCGVPYHALASYLPKMIQNGHKVAICEQMEDPKQAKGVVRREVVRIVTPGAVMEPVLLEDKSHNFLAAVAPSNRGFGLAVVDLSTGLFRVSEFIGERSLRELEHELDRASPKQVLAPDNLEDIHPPLARSLGGSYGACIDRIEGWLFDYENARGAVLEQFNVASLDGFGLEGMDLAVIAAGVAVSYLKDTQKSSLEQINSLTIHNHTDTMPIDPATRRNLELTHDLVNNSRKGSLLDCMDVTRTSMGARTLAEWILRPLIDPEKIGDRLAVVRSFKDNTTLLDSLRDILKQVGDLERITGRVTLKNCSPRDLLALGRSLKPLPGIKTQVQTVNGALALAWLESWDNLSDLCSLLEESISDEPPIHARDGGAIRKGFSKRLDDLKSIQSDSRKLLIELEEHERSRTGITGLRVKYNKVYGYFMEVSRRQAQQAPEDWMRKQSLVNSERFVSPRLKELEEKILGAQESAMELELDIFEKVRTRAASEVSRVQAMASIVGEIDVLSSLAQLARERNYVEPEIDDGDVIEIKQGRHPVLERAGLAERFVPNDASLNRGERMLSVVTGPNMAGKSTFIRQTAIICLMAQVGSFVPALSAKIGVCDRVFTRVGAQDHLQRGQSTFMVEMNETALILNNATSRSLVILDEIGRGTSTFDGISIAWAVAEHLHNLGARTLFATHYHELAELADSLQGVCNLSMAVREWNDEIIFLRKVVEGGADKSYGIQVARLAGLPGEVITRAGEILTQLEADELDSSGHPKLRAKDASGREERQPDLFIPRTSVLDERLRSLDINTMTPVEALNKLAEWKKQL